MNWNYASLRTELFEPSLLALLFTSPAVCFLLLRQHLRPWETQFRRVWATISVWLIAGALSYGITRQPMAIAISLLGMGLTFLLRKPLNNFYVMGQIVLATALIAPLVGMLC